MLILLLSPPAAISSFVGPPAPALEGMVPESRGFILTRAIKAALKEIPGAVVVIEDEAPVLRTNNPVFLKLFNVNIRIFRRAGRWNPNVGPNGPLWVDSTSVLSPGGPSQKGYPIGWGFD